MTSTTRTTDGRDVHARAILGPELYSRLPQTKLLLVGAGGIGCELLKNIVLTGFGHITLLDLDTIDLSNLNRQFLFKKKDVKQSKALIAARTASAFNPNVHITPIHGNIKEPQFDVTWFAGFDIVLNALDNLDARRHVNKMCMAANVPLVESGTAGYLGQVQPILKDRTECFDCVPKPTPKTFPVCTIRSTPSQPIHCIVWAKSYLMPQLFGEDEDSMGELDEAEKQGENAQEIATLRKEASAFKTVRTALRDAGAQGQASAARTVFEKVFHSDIVNLLSMGDMWRSRAPPTPLDFDAIRDGTFTITRDAQPNGAPAANGSSADPPDEAAKANGSAGAEKMLNGSANGESSSSAGLKDQRALSLQDNLELFVSSTERLAARLCAGEDTISFDKDDDDTLDFVTAASNLRSIAYGIPGKSRWEVKEMAGNIIPAIATTNAIIAGLIVLQAFHLLRKSYSALRNVHVQFKPSMPLSSINMSTPSPACGVCKDTYTTVRVDPARVTLGDVVCGVLGGGPGSAEGGIGRREVSVYEDKRVLADPDWDENCEKTLESLGVTRGKFLTIVDEEEEYGTIQVAIAAPASWLPDTLPVPLKKKRAAPPPSTPPPSSLKRPAPDDDVLEVGSSSKRPRANDAAIQFSPNKKRRLDEDGLILLEKQDESLEDDVIVLD
ncbi:hypothetical protein WOLCODRAFT_28912 [Wolfiporia cocos MD-104 SS10]|uniref:Ubiquitin-activating enzyme E1-like n=1 Tax=Wolfiporia cocos (strain MD-104) TaxID=742152 RepID=A0A2H3J4G4_WOLCO|nr:hypothetical protein WOLCODRAFT_28912 [Wolfiporia cocos MD-104 SS10]